MIFLFKISINSDNTYFGSYFLMSIQEQLDKMKEIQKALLDSINNNENDTNIKALFQLLIDHHILNNKPDLKLFLQFSKFCYL